MTPGCLKVRNFLAAFRARGSRDLLEAISNIRMQQSEPSSCADDQLMLSRLYGKVIRTLLVPL